MIFRHKRVGGYHVGLFMKQDCSRETADIKNLIKTKIEDWNWSYISWQESGSWSGCLLRQKWQCGSRRETTCINTDLKKYKKNPHSNWSDISSQESGSTSCRPIDEARCQQERDHNHKSWIKTQKLKIKIEVIFCHKKMGLHHFGPLMKHTSIKAELKRIF